MPRISPIQIAMGIGTAGAMVDVSSYVAFGQGIGRTWGRPSEFRDTAPGMFYFTLENYDGRFTPDNPLSPLATTVTEGMAVSWNLGGRLVAGTVQGIQFAGTETSWGEITITCDDALGNAARRRLGPLAESIALGATPYMYWPLSDAAGSSYASEMSSNGQPNLTYSTNFTTAIAPPTFGITGIPAVGGATQMQLSTTAVQTGFETAPTNAAFSTIPYPYNSMGFWGIWVTPAVMPSVFAMSFAPAGLFRSIQFGLFSGRIYAQAGDAPVIYASTLPVVGVPHYIAIGVVPLSNTAITVTLYVDGISQGSTTYADSFNPGVVGVTTNASRTPTIVQLVVGDGTNPSTVNLSHLSHTLNLPHEETAAVLTEAGRLTAIAATAPELILGTLPADLSTAPLGIQDTSSSTALDAFNAVIRTEQGSIYTTTSGTLLAPVQTIAVRARQRPTSASAITFDASAEISDVPQFIRDATNMVSSITVTGPTANVLVTDPTIALRAKSASTADTILNSNIADLQLWGQDRLIRGKNTNLRVATLSVDAVTTPTATTTKLLALNPGDRIRVTNLPSAQLGFTSWDGWLLGATETHTISGSLFALTMAPVTPATGIYDTTLLTGSDNLTWNTNILTTDTSLPVISADGITFMERTAVPYAIFAGSEQMTVLGCSAPTGNTQFVIVNRGVNGTTAGSYLQGTTFDVLPLALYAF